MTRGPLKVVCTRSWPAHLPRVEWPVGGASGEQEHVDEVDEDAWCALGHVGVILTPFENDHENQVPKQAQDENHLGDELQNDIVSFSEVSGGGKSTYKIEHPRNIST